MSAASPTTTGRLKLGMDVQAVVWLAALPALASLLLPWVLLRPNRLAQGEFLHLPLPMLLLGAALSLALPAVARTLPRALGPLSGLHLALGLYWLGHLCGLALSGKGEAARASASSGAWLWLLGSAVAVYAAQFVRPRLLSWAWLPLLALTLLSGELSHWSVVQEYSVQRERFLQELLQHLKLVFSALGLALVLGGPLAVWASRHDKVAGAVLGIAGGIQTVPSLALLGLLIAPLSALSNAFPALRSVGISGIGTAPALCAMTLYALLPILRNGVIALQGVSAGVLDAATGMGMTQQQRLWRVQLPLALPVWLSGVRQAAVMLVGVASVAQLIGAGGLGYFIFSGMQSGAADLILLGALPAAGLAIGMDILLRLLEQVLGKQLGAVSVSAGGEQ